MEGSIGDYWVDDPVYGLSSLEGRRLDALSNDMPILTGQELYILRTIALVGASISLASGVVVGWWFVRMKRSFRHQYAPRELALHSCMGIQSPEIKKMLIK